jgi:hypothetical protein
MKLIDYFKVPMFLGVGVALGFGLQNKSMVHKLLCKGLV